MLRLMRHPAFTAATLCLAWLSVQTAFAQTPKPQTRFANLDGLRVHYDNYGKGNEALVFVHGWTCNATFWKANVPAFIGQTRVIAIDLPGHGESDKPDNIAYSMDLFARAIDAVLQDAKVERAVLVGHSMGTPVIRQFYRRYPAKVRALVIVDGSLKSMGTKESMKQFLDPFRGPGYKQHAEQMVTYLTQAMKNEQTRNEVKAAMLSAPQHVMISAFDGMLDPEIWKEADKINVPTLALMAVNPQWSADYEKYVRDLVPGIEYQVWPGVSHFLMMDEPEKFNGTLTTFLKKNKIIR
ncbi:MAG: alpha/beta hydrolase [Acidobacteria bacterium]|nr:alpha/beta hydrolase [Acidobacteriota bacterium]MBI3426373.1 alpha/beta hydrolase [Acidobacteriota bacterium]